MYMDKDEFECWMERIMERFDHTDKMLERLSKKNSTLDGEEILDNQDLCLLLKVGIRTLQRYRASGCCLTLPSAARCSIGQRMSTGSSATSSTPRKNAGIRRKEGMTLERYGYEKQPL